jgi:RNA polymerase sigma factor (sigma-70 family)
MTTGPTVAVPPRSKADQRALDKADQQTLDEADQRSLAALSDGDLLTRFFQAKQDAAFSALVARHGPLVFGVCRRILPDANDAEDAFQATFLVLVRKGATLRDPEKLSHWLYGVASRTARKVRSKAALRTKSERQAGEMPTKPAVSEMTYDDLQAVLDEEISQLPEKYALPLVLCYLEGKTNAQAAAQLGWPEGSISRRLSRARELLRSRLAKRGLALSVALIAAVFARPASAAVSTELLATTTRAATLVAEGADLQDVVSPTVAKTTQEILASMSAASKFAVPTVVIVASVLLILTTGVWQLAPAAAHAASNMFHFSRGGGVHGSMRPGSAGQATDVAGTASTSDGACGAATSTKTTPAACGTVP